MFRGHRAWFSQSVSPGPRGLWADGGGTVAHWLDADYLFSSDAAHPDTRSIHESLSYLEGRATVFHSGYLSVCAGAGAGEKPSVVLGHFVLPPACLQDEIRRQIGRFIWEKAEDLEEEDKQPPELLDRDGEQNGPPEIQEEAVSDLLCHLDAHKSMGLDGIHPWVMRELEEGFAKPLFIIDHWSWLTGEVPDDEPNENMTEEPEVARSVCEEEPEEEALDLAESSEETDSEAPAQGEFPYRALQEYPVNNMVTGYPSARDMKKYEGELHDFIPGTSGYAAYWVQSKFSISCEKTKMKRKL